MPDITSLTPIVADMKWTWVVPQSGVIRIAAIGLQGPSGGGGSAGVTSFNTRTGVVALTSADVTTALAYTPVPPSRNFNAGAGLAGGGDLSADRTLALANTAVTPGSYTNANITVDAQGRLTAAASGSAGGAGTVTSVGLAVPSLFTAAGSPVTSAGTITVALATQPQKTFLAGPTSGVDAAPTFRAVASTDLPATVAYTGVANVFTATQTLGTGTLLAAPNKAVTLSANVDNWNPGVARHYRVNATADVIISGMAIGQQDGWEWYIHNAGTGRIFLPSGNANSLAANQFFNVGSFQILLNPGESLRCVYDGTLSLIRTWKLYDPGTQSLNTVLAGPASGPPGLADVPVFRALVAADLPPTTVLTTGGYANPAWITGLDAAKITSGTIPDARLSANVPLLTGGKLSASVLPTSGVTAGSYTLASITVDAEGRVTAASSGSAGGTGTVTSVGLTAPSILSVGGSPVTGSGTLALSLATQSANQVFAGPPTGADAAPAFRTLAKADLPALTASDVGAQPSDAELTALAGLTSAADQLPYFTGSGTAALTTLSSASRSLLATTDAAGARTALGLGTLATKSTVTLTTDVTGVLPSGNLPTTVVQDGDTKFPGQIAWVLANGVDATTGTDKTAAAILPRDCTFKGVRLAGKIGPTGADLIIDLKLNGVSLWAVNTGNRPKITNGSTGGSQTLFDTTAGSAGDLLAIDIAQVGSTTAGQTITVVLYYDQKN